LAPNLDSLSADEKGLPEETVAFLFLIGFVSAGISASFAGTFADRYGRRTACLAYCVLYSFSSFTLLADDIRILFLGRVLGGICGTLLWTVFESWLVAEFNQLMLEDTGSVLGGIFSAMTILNSLVAIFAGILAEGLVGLVGTAKAPFMASIGCLSLAFIAISKFWVSGLLRLGNHRKLTFAGRELWRESPEHIGRCGITSARRGRGFDHEHDQIDFEVHLQGHKHPCLSAGVVLLRRLLVPVHFLQISSLKAVTQACRRQRW
jgi:MFS family permease